MELEYIVEFRKAEIDDAYREKWNIGSLDDFLHLYLNGVKISDTLYRIGGLGGSFKDGYCQLLKQIEDKYSDTITKDKKKKRHLASHSCIINEQGVEKVVLASSFDYLYLQGGVIYSCDGKYYNIETGEKYGDASRAISSKHYIFLDCSYDRDKSKRGVLQINKKTGKYKLFKS